MNTLQGILPAMLSDAEIQRLHEGALALIERVGIAVSDPRLLSRLAGISGVRISAGRVHVSGAVVDDLVAENRQAQPRLALPRESGEIRVLTTGHASHILDPASGKVRPIKCDDLARAARLTEALSPLGVLGGAPGFPSDVAPAMSAIRQFKITLENCRYRGHPGADLIQAAEVIREMCQVVGAPFSTGVHMISPLRLEGNECDIALHFEAESLSVPVGTMPVAGVTAPVQLEGLFQQAMAEVMGGYALLRLAGLQNVSFWVNAYPADMQSLSLVYGSPEHILCDLMQLAINRWYGRSTAAKSLTTMAKAPDMQAATDAATHTAVLMMAGASTTSGAGALSLDEVYSPVKLMIDCDVVDYCRRLVRGLQYPAATSFEDDILQGIAEGTFAGLGATVQAYREVYWHPRLFTRDSLARWQHGGEVSLQQAALDQITKAQRQYDYSLPVEQQRELDRIYARAEAALST